MRYLLSFAAAMVMAAAVLVVPAAANDAESCRNVGPGSLRDGDRIAPCTRAIESRKFGGKTLAELYYARGGAFFFTYNYDRAIEDYTEALRLRPKDDIAGFNTPVYTMRGLAFAHKRDFERAIADYSQTIRIFPKDSDQRKGAYASRAESYSKKGDVDLAIADYNELIKLNYQSRYTVPFYERGALYHKKGDLDRAIADYSEAIRLRPKYTPSFVARGLAYQKKGDIGRAKEDFTVALGLEDHLYDGEFTQNIAKRELAALSESSAKPSTVATPAAPATPSPPPATAPAPQAAVTAPAAGTPPCSTITGSVDERIAACTRAIQNHPKDTTYLFYRGLNYLYDKEDYDRAVADFSEAIRLAPGNPAYRYSRGEAPFPKARVRPRHRRPERGNQA